MLYYLTFLVPFLSVFAVLFITQDYECWVGYLITAACMDGLLYLFFWLLSTTREYLSGFVTAAIHYNAWTERVVRTETRTVNGKTYTSTRVDYVRHPDTYSWLLNTGRECSVTYAAYLDMLNRWRTPVEFHPVPRVNCVAGGNGEICRWNGDENATETVTYTHRYRNPVRYSNSIFSERFISRKEAQRLNLINYPKLSGMDHDPVLVQPGLDASDININQLSIRRVNAFCGHDNQIHVFVLLFKASEGIEIAYRQRSYWKGFNKNEFVVCLGMDGNSVKWCQPMSWMDEPTLAVWAKEFFRDHTDLDLDLFAAELRGNIGKWRRKEFSDFKYLGNKLSNPHKIAFAVITLFIAAATTMICLAIKDNV